jgi:hypothetical protein
VLRRHYTNAYTHRRSCSNGTARDRTTAARAARATANFRARVMRWPTTHLMARTLIHKICRLRSIHRVCVCTYRNISLSTARSPLLALLPASEATACFSEAAPSSMSEPSASCGTAPMPVYTAAASPFAASMSFCSSAALCRCRCNQIGVRSGACLQQHRRSEHSPQCKLKMLAAT